RFLAMVLGLVIQVPLARAVDYRAYVASATNDTLRVIENADLVAPQTDAAGLVTRAIDVGKGPSEVAVDPRGTPVYVTNADDGSLSRIDAASLTEIMPRIELPASFTPRSVAVHPDGTKVYVAAESAQEGALFVIDVSKTPPELVSKSLTTGGRL